MIGSHPGGQEMTARLLTLSGLRPPARILELGAGEGKTAAYLRTLGFEVRAVDLKPSGPGVEQGDIRRLDFAGESFDCCLAECTVSGCGDGNAALKEAFRVLKKNGCLLIADVFFKKKKAPSLSMREPLIWNCWKEAFEKAGFQIEKGEDETEAWKEFFLESLWNGNAEESCVDFFIEAGKAGCGYFLACLMKGEKNGFI